jgi:hypothetical protein
VSALRVYGSVVTARDGLQLDGPPAERGWVCVLVQYRVAPGHRWRRHMRDVHAAVAWTRAQIADFGGHPPRSTIAYLYEYANFAHPSAGATDAPRVSSLIFFLPNAASESSWRATD